MMKVVWCGVSHLGVENADSSVEGHVELYSLGETEADDAQGRDHSSDGGGQGLLFGPLEGSVGPIRRVQLLQL